MVDDNPDLVNILTTSLREEGYGVLGALTSVEGLRLAILSRPELVLPAALRPPDRRRQPLLTSRHRRECRRRNG